MANPLILFVSSTVGVRSFTHLITDGLPPGLREAPCTMGDEDWNTPEVPETVQQLFSANNWTMEDPSPGCFCSCDGRKKMLPECPAGAGGLPPPEVRPQEVQLTLKAAQLSWLLFSIIIIELLCFQIDWIFSLKSSGDKDFPHGFFLQLLHVWSELHPQFLQSVKF